MNRQKQYVLIWVAASIVVLLLTILALYLTR